jgi:hypothetical protein
MTDVVPEGNDDLDARDKGSAKHNGMSVNSYCGIGLKTIEILHVQQYSGLTAKRQAPLFIQLREGRVAWSR